MRKETRKEGAGTGGPVVNLLWSSDTDTWSNVVGRGELFYAGEDFTQKQENPLVTSRDCPLQTDGKAADRVCFRLLSVHRVCLSEFVQGWTQPQMLC